MKSPSEVGKHMAEPLWKPTKTTPQQRKAERQQRSTNTLKPAAKDKHQPRGLTQGKPKVERPPNCFKSYRPPRPKKGLKPGKGFGVQRGTSIKPRRLLEASRPLGGQPGQSALKRFALDRNAMRKLDRVKILRPIGRRGRRLAPEDKKQAALAHQLPCCCGCCLPVEWAHLESRRYEETRHVAHLSIPACHYLHHWLDQGKGTAIRPLLFEMAKAKGERLTHEDIYKAISDAGYYTWLHSTTRI